MLTTESLIPNKRESLAFIMLSFFFITMALCSLQKATASTASHQVEITKQPKAAINFTNSSLACPLENNKLESSLSDTKHSTHKGIVQALLFILLLNTLFSFFKKEKKLMYHAADYTFAVSPLPVYLKHRSLII